jgi:DNA-binding CsgD family transcriptional regulator/tetratricopeptide (TPR) repeat protein
VASGVEVRQERSHLSGARTIPLLEREDSIDALTRALSASRAHGQVAGISGEAGVGKTSIIEVLAAREGQSTSFLWGACEALGTPRPLGPILDMASELGCEFETLITSGIPRHQVFAGFASAIGRRTPPTVVVFEDVHWADEATLDLLRYLSRRIHRVPALVVLTWRADEVGADHPLYRLLAELPPEATHRLELKPLSLDAVARLAGKAHDPATVFRLTRGNPFFVTELLRGSDDEVPARVREAILARRASLPNESRHVVDLVSVVPNRAEIELVRATLESVNEALAPAVDAGLLTFDGRTLGFRHELARLAVLESLPVLRVQALHRTVLDALSSYSDRAGVVARLAHHAVGAGDKSAVQRFTRAAAHQACCLGAHREAAAHYRTALAWSDGLGPSVRAELLDLLGYECYLTGELSAAWEARVEALGLWRRLDVPRAVGADLRWLSRLAWFLGDYAESRQHAMDALDVLTPLGEDEELAMALSNRAQLHMLAREHEPCAIFGQRAIDMARRLGSVEVLSHALNNVGSSQIYLDTASGRQMQEESLALALDHDLHQHAARGFTNLATSAIQSRDYAYAQRWLEAGLNYTHERDLDSWWHYMLAWRARIFVETGRWPEAEADAATVLEKVQPPAVTRIPALTALGLLRARQRKPDAGDLLDEALALALPTAEKQRLIPVRAARAELALLQGRPDDARAEADAGLQLLSQTDLSWEWDLLRYARWRADDKRQVPPGMGCSSAAASPHDLSMNGEWRAAAAIWERLGCPYERAEALADGDVPAKEEALQTFRALGAVAAADRVRQDLRQRGVTRLKRGPRPSTRAHPAGLTARETEILALLAQRLSNPAIGTQLFVSSKTVEHHVSAILAKLEVTSRDEAVTEALRRGWLASPPGSGGK